MRKTDMLVISATLAATLSVKIEYAIRYLFSRLIFCVTLPIDLVKVLVTHWIEHL